jgi:Glyoxalase-like domain
MTQMRLRQICLVAPHLEPAVSDVAAIMGLEVCYRDPHVAEYGLENALLPVDTTLLEVVAPIEPGTAAGRFLEKSRGHGGYMAIFSCDDPDERGRNAEAMGVRIANVIDHPPYHGVQLHPRDCRAAFIEFNHTEGSDDIRGAYPPAGPFWQRSIRTEMTKKLISVELQSPQQNDLAAHWSRLIGVPATTDAHGDSTIELVNCNLRFVHGAHEAMTGLTFRVSDVEAVRSAARTRGCPCAGDAFLLGGVTFHVVA